MILGIVLTTTWTSCCWGEKSLAERNITKHKHTQVRMTTVFPHRHARMHQAKAIPHTLMYWLSKPLSTVLCVPCISQCFYTLEASVHKSPSGPQLMLPASSVRSLRQQKHMARIQQEGKSPHSLSNCSYGLQFPACLRAQGGLKNLQPLSEPLGNPFRQYVYRFQDNMVNKLN